jgi:hypothetical protein
VIRVNLVSNDFKWLASRSVLGGFATAASLGWAVTRIPPCVARDAITNVTLVPAVLLARFFNSVAGDPRNVVVWGGIFDGFGILFYTLLWYVVLSLIAQIKGEKTRIQT